MAAATGVNIGAVGDQQQRNSLNSSLTTATQADQQLKDGGDQITHTFLVTQSLVSLLTGKDVQCFSHDKTDTENNGAINLSPFSHSFVSWIYFGESVDHYWNCLFLP